MGLIVIKEKLEFSPETQLSGQLFSQCPSRIVTHMPLSGRFYGNGAEWGAPDAADGWGDETGVFSARDLDGTGSGGRQSLGNM
jgi:hypothetical protein